MPMPCKVQTCSRDARKKGLCPRHLEEFEAERAKFPNDTDASHMPAFVWLAERRDMDARTRRAS
jgi:hypothetical protein